MDNAPESGQPRVFLKIPAALQQPRGAHREGAQGQDAVAGELRAGQIQVAHLQEAGQEQRGAVGDARVLRQT